MGLTLCVCISVCERVSLRGVCAPGGWGRGGLGTEEAHLAPGPSGRGPQRPRLCLTTLTDAHRTSLHNEGVFLNKIFILRAAELHSMLCF